MVLKHIKIKPPCTFASITLLLDHLFVLIHCVLIESYWGKRARGVWFSCVLAPCTDVYLVSFKSNMYLQFPFSMYKGSLIFIHPKDLHYMRYFLCVYPSAGLIKVDLIRSFYRLKGSLLKMLKAIFIIMSFIIANTCSMTLLLINIYLPPSI